MKKFIKICALSILIMMVLVTITYGFSIGDLNGLGGKTGKIKTVGNKFITVASVGGSIISVVILVILGIKYMLGSVEEKVKYKETLLPYIIGATFVFAASSIAGIIYNFFS